MALLVGDAATTASGQLLAGLLLAGAICAKVEGLPFVLAAVALFLALRRKRHPDRPGRRPAHSSRAPSASAPGSPSAPRGASSTATSSTAASSTSTGKGSARSSPTSGDSSGAPAGRLPWLLPLAALLLAPRKTRLALLPIAVAALLAVFFVFTYLHLPDASLWIEWSAGRVFSPLLALLAIAALCRKGDGRSGCPAARATFTEC